MKPTFSISTTMMISFFILLIVALFTSSSTVTVNAQSTNSSCNSTLFDNCTTDGPSTIDPLTPGGILVAVLLVLFIFIIFSGIIQFVPAMFVFALITHFSGIISAKDFFSGFGNSNVAAVACMGVLIEPISRLAVVKKLALAFFGGEPGHRTRQLTKILVLMALLSILLPNAPQVLLFAQLLKDACISTGMNPMFVMLPVVTVITASNTLLISNVMSLIVAGIYKDATQAPSLSMVDPSISNLVPMVSAIIMSVVMANCLFEAELRPDDDNDEKNDPNNLSKANPALHNQTHLSSIEMSVVLQAMPLPKNLTAMADQRIIGRKLSDVMHLAPKATRKTIEEKIILRPVQMRRDEEDAFNTLVKNLADSNTSFAIRDATDELNKFRNEKFLTGKDAMNRVIQEGDRVLFTSNMFDIMAMKAISKLAWLGLCDVHETSSNVRSLTGQSSSHLDEHDPRVITEPDGTVASKPVSPATAQPQLQQPQQKTQKEEKNQEEEEQNKNGAAESTTNNNENQAVDIPAPVVAAPVNTLEAVLAQCKAQEEKEQQEEENRKQQQQQQQSRMVPNRSSDGTWYPGTTENYADTDVKIYRSFDKDDFEVDPKKKKKLAKKQAKMSKSTSGSKDDLSAQHQNSTSGEYNNQDQHQQRSSSNDEHQQHQHKQHATNDDVPFPQVQQQQRRVKSTYVIKRTRDNLDVFSAIDPEEIRKARYGIVVVANKNPAVGTRLEDRVFVDEFGCSVLCCVRYSDGKPLASLEMAMHVLQPGDSLFIRIRQKNFRFFQTRVTLDNFFDVEGLDLISNLVNPVLKKHYMQVPDWAIPVLSCFAKCLPCCFLRKKRIADEEDDKQKKKKQPDHEEKEGEEEMKANDDEAKKNELYQSHQKTEDVFETVVDGNGLKYVLLPSWYETVTIPIFLLVIVGALLGLDLAILAVIGLGIYCVLGIKTFREIVMLIEWDLIVAIGISFAIGASVQNSGLSLTIGQAIASSGARGFPLVLLTAMMTALISNILGGIGAIQLMFPVSATMFDEAGLDQKIAAIILINTAVAGFFTMLGNPLCIVIASKAPYTGKEIFLFGFPIFVVYNVLTAIFVSLEYGLF